MIWNSQPSLNLMPSLRNYLRNTEAWPRLIASPVVEQKTRSAAAAEFCANEVGATIEFLVLAAVEVALVVALL